MIVRRKFKESEQKYPNLNIKKASKRACSNRDLITSTVMEINWFSFLQVVS